MFNVAAAVSLTLWIATAMLWAHSYWAKDSISVTHTSARRGWPNPYGNPAWFCEEWGLSAEANRGRLEISHDVTVAWRDTGILQPAPGFRIQFDTDRKQSNAYAGQPWFDWTNTFDGTEAGGEAALQIPLPLLLLLASLLPIVALCRIARDRRRPESICRACGYDRRATPGRCPECGAGFAAGGR